MNTVFMQYGEVFDTHEALRNWEHFQPECWEEVENTPEAIAKCRSRQLSQLEMWNEE